MKNRITEYLVVGDYKYYDALFRCGVTDLEIEDALERAIDNLPEVLDIEEELSGDDTHECN